MRRSFSTCVVAFVLMPLCGCTSPQEPAVPERAAHRPKPAKAEATAGDVPSAARRRKSAAPAPVAKGFDAERNLAARKATREGESAATAKLGAKAPGPRDSQPKRLATAGVKTATPETPATPSAADAAATPPHEAPLEDAEDHIASEAALERFQQILRDRPLHRPAFEGLVKHHVSRGTLPDLVREYQKRVAALPDEHSPAIVLARLYLKTNNPEKAAQLVDSLAAARVADGADRAQLLSFKSEIYSRVGRAKEAIDLLDQARRQARTIAVEMQLTESLADLHLAGGNARQAAKVLVDFAGEYPDQFYHRKRIADALAKRELHQEAIGQYTAILALVEKETDKRCEVLRQLGASQEKAGLPDEAVRTYTQAMNLLDGGHWMQRELHERVVSLYRAGGRIEELIEHCRGQVKRSPEQTVLRELLADVLVAADRLDEARAALSEGVQLFPKDRSLSQTRVELLERAADLEGVSEEYQRIIAEHPDEVDLYVAYGQFLASNAQLGQARNQWKHLLDRELADATLANRLGSLFEQFELHDDAAECYERAISLSPGRPESYTALAQLNFARGKRDSALAALARMTEASPGDAALHARAADALLGMSLTQEALAAISRACELAPREHRFQSTRADLLLRSGAVDESLAVRRQALDLITSGQQQMRAIDVLVSMHQSNGKLDQLKQAETIRLEARGDDPLALLVLSRVADAERDFTAMRRLLDKLLAAQPDHEEGRKQLAALHEAHGDLDAAVQEYRTLISLHPNRGRYYYEAIAQLKLRYDDTAGAIEIFDELAAAASQNATVLRSVAEQLRRLDQTEKALGYYQRALAIQPQNHPARLEYAKALKTAGRLDDAMAELRAAALQDADRATASDGVALLHETAGQLGESDRLLEELQRQVEENPDHIALARALAELYVREYEYARAAELLDLVLKHRPDEVDARLVKSELNRTLARFDEAIDGYQRVLRSPNVDRDYVLGEIGKSYFESGRIELARRSWKRIANKLYAGTLLRNNGMPADAVDVFLEGIRLNPEAYSLHRNLIETYEAAGQTDNALQAARRLLDLEPDNALNVKRLAQACLRQGDRAEAARVAGRLFSSGVRRSAASPTRGSPYYGGTSLSAAPMISMFNPFGNAPSHPVAEAVEFFTESGLVAELEDVLIEQLALQPDNGLLKRTAAQYLVQQFGKPQEALQLLVDLEQTPFPAEQRDWLGWCSQRDYFRLETLGLIARVPALRDKRLPALEARPAGELSAYELTTLATIRLAQADRGGAIELLKLAVQNDPRDPLALAALVEALILGEQYLEAEPYAVQLIDRLHDEQLQRRHELREQIERLIVRQLPPAIQVRLDDALKDQMVDKWQRAGAFSNDMDQELGIHVLSYSRAWLSLGTIRARTGRVNEARDAWRKLEPAGAADSEGWFELAGVVGSLGDDESAFSYYQRAIEAAKNLTADPLMNRLYGNAAATFYYGYDDADSIDVAFNKTLEMFARLEKLPELYDFLRDTGRVKKARRIAERYSLLDSLQETYRQRVAQARAAYLDSKADPLDKSLPYFAQVAKLAEIHDWRGNWQEAAAVYQQYLDDFPDELGLLEMLGAVAEANGDHALALIWERQVVEAKKRLSRRGPAWSIRSVLLVPSPPQALAAQANDGVWQYRSIPSYGWGYSSAGGLELTASWTRISRLYLAMGNTIAAVDAMQQAVQTSGDRTNLADEMLQIARSRRLTKEMLPVFRSLSAHLPAHQPLQLAFADALADNGKPQAAADVYRRILRTGASDLEVLNRVHQRLAQLDPRAGSQSEPTLADLEAEVGGESANVQDLLRLGKAYFYSLQIDKALETLLKARSIAPHLAGLDDLLIQIYTLQGRSEELLAQLRAKINRAKDPEARAVARHRLIEELWELGLVDEALDELKKAGNPAETNTFLLSGRLLQYFGRHDEAIEQFELIGASEGAGMQTDREVAQALALRGDADAAAERILSAIARAIEESSQQGAGAGWLWFEQEEREFYFEHFKPLFVAYPEILEKVKNHVVARFEKDQGDLAARRTLIDLHRALGRNNLADALIAAPQAKSLNDPDTLQRQVEQAIDRKDYSKALVLAEQWLAQHPKARIQPGLTVEWASQLLSSPRNQMICTIGDLYWKLGEHEKAFESYRRIVADEDETSKIAYAAICASRGRIQEACGIVDKALAAQQVKSQLLLEFRGFLAVLAGDATAAFDNLAAAFAQGEGESQQSRVFYFGSGTGEELQNEALISLARETGQVDRFVQLLRDRIGKNPNNWQAHLRLADFLRDEGREAQSQAAIEAAAQVKTLKRQVLAHHIHRLEASSESAALVPLYRELIDLMTTAADSDDLAVYGGRAAWRGVSEVDVLRERLAELLWRQGDAKGAVETWLGGKDLQSAETHATLGVWHLEHEEYDLAEQALRAALALDPQQHGARGAMAHLAFQQRGSAAALPHLRHLFEHWSPNDFDGVGHLMRRIALDLRAAADSASPAADIPQAEHSETRLVLAWFAGDWTAVEHELHELTKGPVGDPAIWRLWVQSRQRRADWTNALAGRQQLQRLAGTSLADRRGKLKLTLAGKQVKEAAAGVADAAQASSSTTTPGYQISPLGYRGRYRSYDRGGGAAETPVELYVKLGQFDKAELAILTTQEDSELLLISLTRLKQKQGQPDRVAELARLAVSTSAAVDSVIQPLAECGRADLAIDLLIRASRLGSPEREPWEAWTYAYGSSGALGGLGDFEDSEAGRGVRTLYELLVQQGQYDRVTAALGQEHQQDADDHRLAKLMADLEALHGRLESARDRVAALARLRPEDFALRSRLFNLNLQLRDWPAVLAVADQARQDDADSAHQWRLRQAVVHVLAGHSDLAIDLLTADASVPSEHEPAWCAVLAAAGRYDRMIQFLEARRAVGGLGKDAREALFYAYTFDGRLNEAARLALEEFWRENELLGHERPWFVRLHGVIRAARRAGADLAPDTLRAEDRALLLLIAEGPASGQRAFQDLVEAQGDNVNARRGLVVAARLAGDADLAASANGQLIEWLKSRRQAVWLRPEAPPLERRAAAFLEQWQAGIATGGLLDVASLVPDLLERSMSFSNDDGEEVTRYESLFEVHRRLQQDLLLENGLAAEFVQLVRTPSEATGYDGREQDAWHEILTGEGQQGRWRDAAHDGLYQHRFFEELLAEVDRPGPRPPPEKWLRLSQACAALGRLQDARRWKNDWVEDQIAAILLGDEPAVEEDQDAYEGFHDRAEAWREHLKALEDYTIAVDESARDATDPWRRGEADMLAAVAALEPAVEERLAALAEPLAPGWGDSRSLAVLVEFHTQKREPRMIVDLLRRVFDVDGLISSDYLSQYLRACYEARDYAGVQSVLDALAERSPRLNHRIELERLLLVRHQGDLEAADRLERELLKACRGRSPSAWRVDHARLAALKAVWINRQSDDWPEIADVTYLNDPDVALAAQAGLRIEPDIKPEHLTLARIRQAYARHGFHQHAARLAALELDQLPQDEPEANRFEIVEQRARLLDLAGLKDESRRLYEQVVAYWTRLETADPASIEASRKLAALFALPALGPDYERSLVAHREARRWDPGFDASGLLEASYLYQSARYNEAWSVYDQAIRRGGSEQLGVNQLYQAGISAHHAGFKNKAISLLRQALWRGGAHELADQAKEFLRDAETNDG